MVVNKDTVAIVATATPVVAIILVIIGGNALVVLAVAIDRHLRGNIQNFYIVSLAAADAFVGLLIMPLSLTYQIIDQWIFGEILCEIWLALDVLFVTASILNMCLIAYDRYRSVTDPIDYLETSGKQTLAVIAAAWITSFLISFPPLVGWRPEKRTAANQCNLSDDIGYVLYSALGSFFLPTGVLLAVYYRIYAVMRSRTDSRAKLLAVPHQYGSTAAAPLKKSGSQQSLFFKHMPDLSIPRRSLSLTVLPPIPTLSKYNSTPQMLTFPLELEKRKRLKRKEKRGILILGVVILAFIVCWLPFFLCYVLNALGCKIPQLLFKVFFWAGYVNSGLNPIIYTIFNPSFRKVFKEMVACQKFRPTSKGYSHPP